MIKKSKIIQKKNHIIYKKDKEFNRSAQNVVMMKCILPQCNLEVLLLKKYFYYFKKHIF